MVPVCSIDCALLLLDAIHLPIIRAAEAKQDVHQIPGFAYLSRTTTAIWHDTMRKVKTIPAKDEQHRALLEDTVRIWQAYGFAFGLEEGAKVTTTKAPSTPSKDPKYWKIPKRCFSNACWCSQARAPHQLRVCKGCYRVLYCSPKCQTA